LAQQAVQARESEVFFRIANRARPMDTSGREQGVTPHLEASLPGSDTRRSPASVAPAEGDQNNQQRKLDFLQSRNTGSIYNPHALQTPASPHQVMSGSVIAASLITGINSDLPGLVAAQVTEN